MLNKVKIFDVLGFGQLIGKVKRSTDTHYIIEHPGKLSVTPAHGGDFSIKIVLFIFPFVKNQKELLKEFPLRKDLIFFFGKADDAFANVWEQHVRECQGVISGIQVVGSNALANLPRQAKPN